MFKNIFEELVQKYLRNLFLKNILDFSPFLLHTNFCLWFHLNEVESHKIFVLLDLKDHLNTVIKFSFYKFYFYDFKKFIKKTTTL